MLVASASSSCPAPPGEALRKAQDEYIVSLDTFPDVASNHAAKGWLEAERGNVDRRARRLEQGDARRAELRVSVGGEGRAAGAGRKVRRGGGDVEEGPIDRACLSEHRSADCGSGEAEVSSSQVVRGQQVSRLTPDYLTLTPILSNPSSAARSAPWPARLRRVRVDGDHLLHVSRSRRRCRPSAASRDRA